MSARLLLIDNYDSFTYNLVQAFLVLGADVLVYRNDAITVDAGARARADAPVHLAGAGHAAAGGRVDRDDPRLRRAASRCSACASATSRSPRPSAAQVVRAPRLMHGKTSPIEHDGAACSRASPTPARSGAIIR